MATQVSRDPFARESLVRESVEVSGCVSCSWCGNVRLAGRRVHAMRDSDGKAKLFRYTVETDGGRSFQDDKLFCSLSCRRSYQS